MYLTNFDDEKVIDSLNKSQVIAIPTETVYGFAIRYDSEIAYERLCSLKGRRADKPIAIMCSETFFRKNKNNFQISSGAKRLIDKFLPGPLTVLLQAENMPYQTHLGTNVVGIRIPNDKKLLNFLNKIDFALQVTSANKSSLKPLTTYEDVLKNFENEKDLSLIVKGKCVSNIPTTVCSLTSSKPVIVRVGEIKKEQIEEVFYGGEL